MWAEAASSASELRSNLRDHRFQQQHEWEGVLFWAKAPAAGQEATILYNKASGAIRSDAKQ